MTAEPEIKTEDSGGPFDFVTVLDYVDEPFLFVRRMLELSRKTAMFSVPKPSLVRANLRKSRDGHYGVSVHFYSDSQIRHVCDPAGAKKTTVKAIPAGYFVAC